MHWDHLFYLSADRLFSLRYFWGVSCETDFPPNYVSGFCLNQAYMAPPVEGKVVSIIHRQLVSIRRS